MWCCGERIAPWKGVRLALLCSGLFFLGLTLSSMEVGAHPSVPPLLAIPASVCLYFSTAEAVVESGRVLALDWIGGSYEAVGGGRLVRPCWLDAIREVPQTALAPLSLLAGMAPGLPISPLAHLAVAAALADLALSPRPTPRGAILPTALAVAAALSGDLRGLVALLHPLSIPLPWGCDAVVVFERAAVVSCQLRETPTRSSPSAT